MLNYAIEELAHTQAGLAELFGSRLRSSEILSRRSDREQWPCPALGRSRLRVDELRRIAHGRAGHVQAAQLVFCWPLTCRPFKRPDADDGPPIQHGAGNVEIIMLPWHTFAYDFALAHFRLQRFQVGVSAPREAARRRRGGGRFLGVLGAGRFCMVACPLFQPNHGYEILHGGGKSDKIRSAGSRDSM
jgi:hypothetical protein